MANQICTMWAHYECAGVDDNVFTVQLYLRCL